MKIKIWWSLSGVIFAPFLSQMCSPTLFSWVNVQMAQRTPVSCGRRLSRNTLFFFNMRLENTLMHCLLAPWTFFIKFTFVTLSYLMRSIRRYFDGLIALFAYHEHRTSIKQMKIFVIFNLELLIKSSTKLTHIFWICYCLCLWNFNKLVLCLLKLLSLMLNWYFFSLIWLFTSIDWSLISIPVIFSSTFMKFLLNSF